MANYTLGRDYTVSGLAGISDLTLTRDSERIDVTTRSFAKPFKLTVAGFEDVTFECTVLATPTTSFSIGQSYAVTVQGNALSLICMAAVREEPQAGVITFKLTLRNGVASATADQVQVGPGTYRT